MNLQILVISSRRALPISRLSVWVFNYALLRDASKDCSTRRYVTVLLARLSSFLTMLRRCLTGPRTDGAGTTQIGRLRQIQTRSVFHRLCTYTFDISRTMSLQNDDEREPLLSGHGRGHATQWPSTEQIEHSTNRPDDTADEDERSQSYSSGLVLKLGASMFDFSLTGCSMAALGVSWHCKNGKGPQ